MQPRFTEDDLILYIYNELSETERLTVQQAIDTDASLRNMYGKLLEMVEMLNTVSLEPQASTIELIMEHAHYEEHSH